VGKGSVWPAPIAAPARWGKQFMLPCAALMGLGARYTTSKDPASITTRPAPNASPDSRMKTARSGRPNAPMNGAAGGAAETGGQVIKIQRQPARDGDTVTRDQGLKVKAHRLVVKRGTQVKNPSSPTRRNYMTQDRRHRRLASIEFVKEGLDLSLNRLSTGEPSRLMGV